MFFALKSGKASPTWTWWGIELVSVSADQGPSNAFEPAGDRRSNLVGTVLLHEVETSDDDAMLFREAARQSPDSARDEYTELRVEGLHFEIGRAHV